MPHGLLAFTPTPLALAPIVANDRLALASLLGHVQSPGLIPVGSGAVVK